MRLDLQHCVYRSTAFLRLSGPQDMVALNSTASEIIGAVGPALVSPDGRSAGAKLLYFELPSDLLGRETKLRDLVMETLPT